MLPSIAAEIGGGEQQDYSELRRQRLLSTGGAMAIETAFTLYFPCAGFVMIHFANCAVRAARRFCHKALPCRARA